MAFGKSSGPPASHQQMQELVALLERAGHTDFRDARGPMGFTQRQAGGKFTRDEAQQFIEQLEEEEAERAAPKKPALRVVEEPAPPSAFADVPSEDLASELRRRGWTVREP
jgi:hypothetical protein